MSGQVSIYLKHESNLISGVRIFLSAKYISDRSFLELPFLSIPWLMCFSVQALLFLDGRKKYLANGHCHLAKPWHQHSSLLHPSSLLPTSTPKEGEEDERPATPPHLHTCNSACVCCLPRNQRTSMDYIPPTELPAQRVGFFKARYEELSFEFWKCTLQSPLLTKKQPCASLQQKHPCTQLTKAAVKSPFISLSPALSGAAFQ